jgi:hypothetical protein
MVTLLNHWTDRDQGSYDQILCKAVKVYVNNGQLTHTADPLNNKLDVRLRKGESEMKQDTISAAIVAIMGG